jgi:hypothetical protein
VPAVHARVRGTRAALLGMSYPPHDPGHVVRAAGFAQAGWPLERHRLDVGSLGRIDGAILLLTRRPAAVPQRMALLVEHVLDLDPRLAGGLHR